MKVMVADAPYNLVTMLSRRPDIELIVADSPATIADCKRDQLKCETWNYKTRAKVDPRGIWSLRQAILKFRPDVVHAFLGRSIANTVLATVGMKSPPKIVSFRGIETTPRYLDPANHLSFLHPRVEMHACESNAVRDGLVRGGISAERCVTVYNCVFPIYGRPGRAALEEFNIPADAFVVGTIATIRPVKGTDILLEAAIRSAALPNTYFLLIGQVKDPRVERLAQDPRIRDRVRMIGHRNDAAALITGADVFAMPSRSEGLCRALLETMTQGVCPIVSDAGGMKELVRNGIDGVVFPKENPQALADVIRTLHGSPDLVRAYAASAQRRVADLCSAEQMCERTVSIYRRLAA